MKTFVFVAALFISATSMATTHFVEIQCVCSYYGQVDDIDHQAFIKTEWFSSARLPIATPQGATRLDEEFPEGTIARKKLTVGTAVSLGILDGKEAQVEADRCRNKEKRDPSYFGCASKIEIRDRE